MPKKREKSPELALAEAPGNWKPSGEQFARVYYWVGAKPTDRVVIGYYDGRVWRRWPDAAVIEDARYFAPLSAPKHPEAN